MAQEVEASQRRGVVGHAAPREVHRARDDLPGEGPEGGGEEVGFVLERGAGADREVDALGGEVGVAILQAKVHLQRLRSA